MTLNRVTVVCDITDGQGNPILSGTGLWNPSVQVTDATDHMLIAPGVGIPAAFKSTGSPQVTLIADDNSQTLPAGWRWVFTPPSGLGLPGSYTYDIAFANGATQYLSALTPVSTAVSTFPLNPMTAKGDLIYGGSSPAGIPQRLAVGSPGEVLNADGTGVPAWKTLTAADVGALPAAGGTVSGDLDVEGTLDLTSGATVRFGSAHDTDLYRLGAGALATDGTFTAFGGVPGTMRQVAVTAEGGFALQNATPVILTWNVPNDGQLHFFFVAGGVHVTSNETGGHVNMSWTLPDATPVLYGFSRGDQTAGYDYSVFPLPLVAEPGTTVQLIQDTPLTGGAAVLWAAIFGS